MNIQVFRGLVDNAKQALEAVSAYQRTNLPEKPAWAAVCVASGCEYAAGIVSRALDMLDQAIANGAI